LQDERKTRLEQELDQADRIRERLLALAEKREMDVETAFQLSLSLILSAAISSLRAFIAVHLADKEADSRKLNQLWHLTDELYTESMGALETFLNKIEAGSGRS